MSSPWLIHCLKTLKRHQILVWQSEYLCSSTIGHTVTAYQKSLKTKGRGLIPYIDTHTHTPIRLLTRAFVYISVNSSTLTRLIWYNDITKIGRSHYFIPSTTNSCNPHDSRKAEDSGYSYSFSGQCIDGKGSAIWLNHYFLNFLFANETHSPPARNLKYLSCNMGVTDGSKLWICSSHLMGSASLCINSERMKVSPFHWLVFLENIQILQSSWEWDMTFRKEWHFK